MPVSHLSTTCDTNQDEMHHFVYILQSLKDKKYYIGETSDVEARLVFHNSGRQRSTKRRIPFVLILTETFPSRAEALKREKQIKSWKGGTAFKKLITGA
jgi:putative endonuclease